MPWLMSGHAIIGEMLALFGENMDDRSMYISIAGMMHWADTDCDGV